MFRIILLLKIMFFNSINSTDNRTQLKAMKLHIERQKCNFKETHLGAGGTHLRGYEREIRPTFQLL